MTTNKKAKGLEDGSPIEDLLVDRVDGVDEPANRRSFLMAKSANGLDSEEIGAMLEKSHGHVTVLLKGLKGVPLPEGVHKLVTQMAKAYEVEGVEFLKKDETGAQPAAQAAAPVAPVAPAAPAAQAVAPTAAAAPAFDAAVFGDVLAKSLAKSFQPQIEALNKVVEALHNAASDAPEKPLSPEELAAQMAAEMEDEVVDPEEQAKSEEFKSTLTKGQKLVTKRGRRREELSSRQAGQGRREVALAKSSGGLRMGEGLFPADFLGVN